MKYEDIINKIYINFKQEAEYSDIDFIRENNTNIVKYAINNPDYKMAKGLIINQNHLIIICFRMIDENEEYIVFSKAYLSKMGINYYAIISNCLLKNDFVISKQVIGRYFKNETKLYVKNEDDVILKENSFDEKTEQILDDLINNKKFQKTKDYKI